MISCLYIYILYVYFYQGANLRTQFELSCAISLFNNVSIKAIYPLFPFFAKWFRLFLQIIYLVILGIIYTLLIQPFNPKDPIIVLDLRLVCWTLEDKLPLNITDVNPL